MKLNSAFIRRIESQIANVQRVAPPSLLPAQDVPEVTSSPLQHVVLSRPRIQKKRKNRGKIVFGKPDKSDKENICASKEKDNQNMKSQEQKENLARTQKSPVSVSREELKTPNSNTQFGVEFQQAITRRIGEVKKRDSLFVKELKAKLKKDTELKKYKERKKISAKLASGKGNNEQPQEEKKEGTEAFFRPVLIKTKKFNSMKDREDKKKKSDEVEITNQDVWTPKQEDRKSVTKEKKNAFDFWRERERLALANAEALREKRRKSFVEENQKFLKKRRNEDQEEQAGKKRRFNRASRPQSKCDNSGKQVCSER